MPNSYLTLLAILLQLISLIVLLGGCLSMLVIFLGPPFVPTPMHIIQELIQIANISKDDVIIDLGSGDGRMLIQAARQGAIAKGWEINPILVLWTHFAIRRHRLGKNIKIHFQNYFKADLSDATIVFLYNFPLHVPKLEQKLQKDLPAGTTVISYKFTFPTLKLTATPKPHIFVYTT